MNSTLSDLVPIKGAENDRSNPEARRAWLEQRRGGFTATDARDWGQGSKRRAIITEKVTGVWDDTSNRYYDHGIRREPVLAEWIEQRFGITPCNNVYARADEPRHLASPDGVSLDPFTGALLVGSVDAALAEIKTSTVDLTPGPVDATHTLIRLSWGSDFEKSGYYTQIQWQMYVMNAVTTLFVWERHESRLDAETGDFVPTGPPEWCWIPRDQEFIDRLVNDLAPRALAEIDAARLANSGDLPPASNLPSDEAMLVADLLRARDAEAVAAAAKKQAWDALKALYVGQGKPDFTVDAGIAQVTVSTTHSVKRVTDEEAMRKKAPALVERYEALRERFTVKAPVETQALTITPKDNV